MRLRPPFRAPLLGALLLLAPALHAQGADRFIGVRVDLDRNKVLLEVTPDRLGKDFLHQVVLATGLGTGAVGLDRGETGGATVVRFERMGKRVLLVTDNWGARALDGDAGEKRAAAESFPGGVIAQFPIESETGGTLVVDATGFFLSDVYGIGETIRRAQQGSARVDAGRSWIDTARTKAFPKNTEIHARLTLAVDNPGQALRRTAADPASPQFALHHSLVALPDADGFRPRRHDPRTGFFGESFSDFGQGLDGNYDDGFANRWRLVPKDPAAYQRGQLTEPVNPVVYYLDPGIPEPYRTAFLEGGNWWNKVFEAAGWKNGFQVKPLPAGADPMDARYNLIYWVHRVGPGPSVGPSFSDPRTGEIVRTVIRMDSWRSLIDYNIWAGLVPAAGTPNLSAEALAMARRRQHVAHEIGHTLGLSHNFIAASQDRASVMDYPFPIVTVDAAGKLDFSRAYAPFAGAWDSLAIRWGYTWYPDEAKEKAGLERIVKAGLARGQRFIADQHAGAEGSIPEATRWVEGRTMFDALARTKAVRRVAIDRFDERAIKEGEPMYLLNMRFAHVYLHHRYSLEGVIKNVGGMDFTYAMRGDGQAVTTIIDGATQRRALNEALDALQPAELAVPEKVLRMIPPVPPGGDGQLAWMGYAGTTIDQVALAGGLATEVIEGLLERERLNRVALFFARGQSDLNINEVMQAVVDRAWGTAIPESRDHQALQRVVRRVALNTLLDRAGDPRASADVRQVAEFQLDRLKTLLGNVSGGSPAELASRANAIREITRYFDGNDDPAKRTRYRVVPLPWP